MPICAIGNLSAFWGKAGIDERDNEGCIFDKYAVVLGSLHIRGHITVRCSRLNFKAR